MSKDQKNLKRPNTALEDQFEFPNFPKWKNGTIQKVLGSDIVVNEPSNIVGEVRSPNCVEFSIRSDEVLSFGPNTRFRVKGTFQKRKLVTDEWQNCVAADYADVIVMPNWWEMLIKDFEIWHGSTKIASSDEGRFVSQYLNTFKYCFMDKKQKKILCPEPCHPGYGVPTEVGDLGWENKAGSEWEAYAKEIFKPNVQLEFTWTPMDTQPFFQFCNYLQESSNLRSLQKTAQCTSAFFKRLQCQKDSLFSAYQRMSPRVIMTTKIRRTVSCFKNTTLIGCRWPSTTKYLP